MIVCLPPPTMMRITTGMRGLYDTPNARCAPSGRDAAAPLLRPTSHSRCQNLRKHLKNAHTGDTARARKDGDDDVLKRNIKKTWKNMNSIF